jgi:hypothetical protein
MIKSIYDITESDEIKMRKEQLQKETIKKEQKELIELNIKNMVKKSCNIEPDSIYVHDTPFRDNIAWVKFSDDSRFTPRLNSKEIIHLLECFPPTSYIKHKAAFLQFVRCLSCIEKKDRSENEEIINLSPIIIQIKGLDHYFAGFQWITELFDNEFVQIIAWTDYAQEIALLDWHYNTERSMPKYSNCRCIPKEKFKIYDVDNWWTSGDTLKNYTLSCKDVKLDVKKLLKTL